MRCFGVLLFLSLLMGCSDEGPLIYPIGDLSNLGFEEGLESWQGQVQVGSQAYFAAPEGSNYAILTPQMGMLQKITDFTLDLDKTYTLKFWTRGLMSESYLQALKSGFLPQGNTEIPKLEFEVLSGGTLLAQVQREILTNDILRDGERILHDDGFSVWVDGNYRIAPLAGAYQMIDQDPITDAWQVWDNIPEVGIAPKILSSTAGLKAAYGFEGDEAAVTEIFKSVAQGEGLSINWSDAEVVMTNNNAMYPNTFILDPYLFEDPTDGSLWMLNGGTPIYITPMDPLTGNIEGNPEDMEINDHYAEILADWQGDEWTVYSDGSVNQWFEGAALFKEEEYYYLLASYGALESQYTIRMGRSLSPIGPFLDKEGSDMMEYGNSFLLGDERNQLVPGHPFVWSEQGVVDMGYDYRMERAEGFDFESGDFAGIRRLYFVDGWPTIWTPIEVQLQGADYPEAIGENLEIRFKNTGTDQSILGIDHLTIRVD